MKKILFYVIACLGLFCKAQTKKSDSLSVVQLQEIIVIDKKISQENKTVKALTMVDEYLQQAAKINMIKRGAYAWEPMINSMATERTVITIDGMRIFGACTDKMDPVTSYVEISNLSQAHIISGQQGSQHGPTIGGAIDLIKTTARHKEKGWDAIIRTGYETNNEQKIGGGSIAYNDGSFYASADAMYRDAQNYKAGKGQEVPFSQFTKYNMSSTMGYTFHKKHGLESTVIYDKATDVGYPALPMDVALAKALITSLKYEYIPLSGLVTSWETKLYYNTITHIMDDSKRPDVPVRMDMPGWSDTYGGYSKMKGKWNNHEFLMQFNSFYNRSLAEMTMYGTQPAAIPMFMYTWPDVRTQYAGVFLEDTAILSQHEHIKGAVGIGRQVNTVASALGLQSLQIFYPDMKASKDRILKNISATYGHHKHALEYGIGLAYGERAPSVSEGYGFYLYNSHDFFDYIGNPHLKNEKSWEGNFIMNYYRSNAMIKTTTSLFYIQNYILGRIEKDMTPMTIGASGVKRYEGMPYALLFNTALELEYPITTHWRGKAQVVYYYGKDSKHNNLPFISPIRYTGTLQYKNKTVLLEFLALGNLTQTQYAPVYGENRTPAFLIFTLNSGYDFFIGLHTMKLQIGIENILDKNYTTFSDWNNIPRQGRNGYINLAYMF